MPKKLIVSLTSHPSRFGFIDKSIKCLLTQSIRPDAVILWVGEENVSHLPSSILALQGEGLEIRATKELGVFTKVIPAFKEFPGAYIAIADDDLFYKFTWLGELVKSWQGVNNEIICHRAHKIRFDGDGMPLPYMAWEFELKSPEASPDIFPTGVGGVLFPPGAFKDQALDENLFRTLSPYNDDIWLYYMGRRSGRLFRKIGGHFEIVTWPNTQEVALAWQNQGGRNDQQLRKIIDHFGIPLAQVGQARGAV